MSKQTDLQIEHLPISSVEPNPWNPNKQNERQYQAEIESIVQNGFIAPILVRKFEDTYQIVDGEHRWKALRQIAEDGMQAKHNVPKLIADQTIPAIVLDISETAAKKLTVIMNETRGRADLSDLGALLQDIQIELGDDLITGLPYTEGQLKELMGIADFDWDQFDDKTTEADFEHQDGEGFRVIALLNTEDEERWKGLLGDLKDELPSEPKEQAGALIAHLLNKAGI
jgi:hypothetical protein